MSNFVKKWKIKFLEISGDRMVKYGNYFLMVNSGNDWQVAEKFTI